MRATESTSPRATTLATRVLPSLLLTRGTVDLSRTPPFDGPTLPYSAVRAGGRVLNTFPFGHGLRRAAPRRPRAPRERRARHARARLALGEARGRGPERASPRLLFLGSRAALGRRRGARDRRASSRSRRPSSRTPRRRSGASRARSVCLALALFLALRARPLPALGGLRHGRRASPAGRRPPFGAAAIGAALLATDRRAAARYAAALGVRRSRPSPPCSSRSTAIPLGAYGADEHGTRAPSTRTSPAASPAFSRARAAASSSSARGSCSSRSGSSAAPAHGPGPLRRGPSRRSRAAAGDGRSSRRAHVQWWGGWSLGPRLVTEAAPFLALASIPAPSRVARRRSGQRSSLSSRSPRLTQFLLAYAPRRVGLGPARPRPRRAASAVARARQSARRRVGRAARAPGTGSPRRRPGPRAVVLPRRRRPRADRRRAASACAAGARIEAGDLSVTVYIDGVARTPAIERPRARVPTCAPPCRSSRDCADRGLRGGLRLPARRRGPPRALRRSSAPRTGASAATRPARSSGSGTEGAHRARARGARRAAAPSGRGSGSTSSGRAARQASPRAHTRPRRTRGRPASAAASGQAAGRARRRTPRTRPSGTRSHVRPHCVRSAIACEAGAGRHGQPLGGALRERAGAERLDLPFVVARRDRRAPRDEKERRGQDETRGGEEPRAARAEPPLRERPEGRGPERDGRERQALVLRQDRRAEEEPRGESLRETRAFRRQEEKTPSPEAREGKVAVRPGGAPVRLEREERRARRRERRRRRRRRGRPSTRRRPRGRGGRPARRARRAGRTNRSSHGASTISCAATCRTGMRTG